MARMTEAQKRKLQSDTDKLKNENEKRLVQKEKLLAEIKALEQQVSVLKSEREKQMKNEYSTAELISEIEKLIDKHDISEFYELVKYIKHKKNCSPEICNACVIYADYFQAYLKSRRRCRKKDSKAETD